MYVLKHIFVLYLHFRLDEIPRPLRPSLETVDSMTVGKVVRGET